MEIRALAPSDDRSSFRSGDVELDRFFAGFAGQNQFKHHVGATYVAAEGSAIAGFATISPAHVEVDELPSRVRGRLPRYPIPILRLARLAVAVNAQGQGVGRALLRFVLSLALRMSREYGCAGVVVDAKPTAVDFHAKYGFVPIDLLEGEAESSPRPRAMFLPVRAIGKAAGP